MKTTVALLMFIALGSPAFACSVAKNGDYLFSSDDPTTPTLRHHGKFVRCTSSLNAIGHYAGQVMDCGFGAHPIGTTATGVMWNGRLFRHTTKCPVLPASLDPLSLTLPQPLP